MAEDLDVLSFEDALGELEQIVRGLEGGQQKLEEAILCFERGAVLRRHCEVKLAQAEARVQVIVEQGSAAALAEASQPDPIPPAGPTP